MATKKPEDNSTAAVPRRSTARKITKSDPGAPTDRASVTTVEAMATAADMSGRSPSGGSRPSADEIAQLAYQRYLSRGGADGSDFDDWIEAERELTSSRR